MRAPTRFLVVSGVAIGVPVVLAVVLVLTVGDGGSTTLLPEDTPEGVVQRYLLAIEAEDYEEAYSYLSSTAREELLHWSWINSGDLYQEQPAWNATLGESWVFVNVATVEVTFTIFQSRGLFNSIHTYHVTFRLNKEGDSWGITEPTNLWFL